MANPVIKFNPAQPPDLVSGYTQGEAYTLLAPALASDPLTISNPAGTSFSWQPTELAYRDASGQLDYIVGSSPVSLSAVGTQARYSRTFPQADDIFQAQADRVKHWTVLHEAPRQPAAYLGFGVEFGVSGLVSGTSLPTGSLDEISTAPFSLPRPVIRDRAGNEITGRYEVVDSANGQQVFIWFPASFLTAAVFPIMIDPTVVVASTYGVSNGQKLVRLSSGAIYAAARNGTTDFRIYKSVDNGTTWALLITITESGYDVAIATDKVSLFVLNSFSTTGVHFRKYNEAGVLQGSVIDVDASQTDIAACSLVANGTGTLHAAWASKNSTYPNSLNIRYSTSTDGGATWAAPTQITNTNANSPCIAINGPGYPMIAYSYTETNNNSIRIAVRSSSAWTIYTIYNNTSTYLQLRPCIVVDSNGYIYCFWEGADSVETAVVNIRWSKSADHGATWSAMAKLTTGNTYNQYDPSAMVDFINNNKIRVFFHGRASGLYDQIREIESANGGTTWSAIIDKTANTTASAQTPKALCSSPFIRTSDDAARWIYLDLQAGAINYDYIALNQPPLAPTNLTRSNFDATTAVDFTWQFNDGDALDTQSAYMIEIIIAGLEVKVFTGKVAGTISSYRLPAGTLLNGDQYQWRVATWDSSDILGPYSTLATFYTSAVPTVAITNPDSDGAVVATSSLTVQWSMSDPESKGQSVYQVKLTDNADIILWGGGKVADVNARSKTITYTLVSNTSYKVKITVWDADNVASSEVVRTFAVYYTAPAVPTLATTAGDCYISCAVTNPPPSTNLLTANQSNVETDLTGFSFVNAALTRDTTTAWEGAASAKAVVTVSGGASISTDTSIRITINPNTAYTFSLYPKAQAAAGRTWKLMIYWYDSGGVLINSASAISSAVFSAFGQRLAFTATSPANAASCYVKLYINAALTGESFWWDGAQFEPAATASPWMVGGSVQPAVNTNDLYRRKQGETAWTRIATGIPVNGSYSDYAVASGQAYEYMARALGDNGTTADSAASNATLNLADDWLHAVSDTTGSARAYAVTKRDADLQLDLTMAKYAGRTRPVAKFGENDDYQVPISILITSDGDRDALLALVQRKGTVCYRDPRGRKVFGVIPGIPISDIVVGYTTTIVITETSYSEVV